MEPLGTFDDYIVVPGKGLNSRFDADPYIELFGFKKIVPFIPANMITTATRDMAFALYDLGVVVPFHRFQKIENQVKIVKDLYESLINKRTPIAATVGVDDPDRARQLSKFVDVFFLDLAYAYTDKAINEVKKLKESYAAKVVVGNVCTRKGVEELDKAGADMIKIGTGSGSVCITQRITGCGFPQLDSLRYCACEQYKVISDGGIRSSGDIIKALVAGSSMVMTGSLFAGTDESAGHGNSRIYSGMASKEARLQKDDRLQEGIVSEGISITVPYKGSAKRVTEDLLAGIRQGMSLVGAKTIKELKDKGELRRITQEAQIEGSPHILNRS